MRAAPPAVELTLDTGLRERVGIALLYAAAASVLAAWLMARQLVHGFADSPALTLSVASLIGALVGWHAVRPLQGRLRWDGTGWFHVPVGGMPAQPLRAVHLQMDLGGWLLLRATRGDRRQAAWCGVTARRAGIAWHGLRVALYHRPAAAAMPRGVP